MPASRHQKEGSRIPGVSPKTQLHEIGFERLQAALQRAAQHVDGAASSRGYHGALLVVGKPAGDASRELCRVVHLFGPARAVERRIDVGEIPYMRTMHDGGAKLYRLDRVLPAMLNQRSAHEHYRRHAIDQTKLPHGIGHIDV